MGGEREEWSHGDEEADTEDEEGEVERAEVREGNGEETQRCLTKVLRSGVRYVIDELMDGEGIGQLEEQQVVGNNSAEEAGSGIHNERPLSHSVLCADKTWIRFAHTE